MNFIGFKTLYIKEVRRFLKVYNQTLIAPMVNGLLFLAIFSLALQGRISEVNGIPFLEFILPGLIMMTVVQNAFANTSSSLIMGKVLGNIIDYLIPPLSAFEVTLGVILAGITRGILAGLCLLIAASFFIDVSFYNILYTILYALLASSLLSILGTIGGIFANSFDQMSAITSYIITPLSFLSGTFYSTKNLPDFWQIINQFNPFFYMIDGFRYSMTGISDASIMTGISILLIFNVILFFIAWKMIATGYRIKN